MKKLIFLILPLVFISCTRSLKEDKLDGATPLSVSGDIQSEAASTYTLGIPGQEPDLYIPELEYDWNGSDYPFGIRAGGMQAYNNGEGGYDVYYNCPIANALPFDYTGASDFVVCKPCDSASDGLPGYTFHGMLAIEVFQNGLPVSITKKESYAIVNTDRRNGIQSSLIKSWNRVAPVDTMYISAGCADTYRNYGKAFEGKNVIVVIINPDLAIHERNYDNNASSLPISIGNGSAVVDLSALDENVPHAATNLTATISKGKVKILTLNWDCPYHEPTYVYHDFTLRQDGVVIATGFDTSSYQLTLTNGQKHLYEIIINIKGLGSSPPITIKI